MTVITHAEFENTWFLNGEDLPDGLIEDFTSTLCPPVFFDDLELARFTRLVLASLSLTLVEKNRIFEMLPTLSLFQTNELEKVFLGEIKEFMKLDEARHISQLSTAAIFGAFCLAIHRGVGCKDSYMETSLIRIIAKRKLAINPDARKKLQSAAGTPLVDFFYGYLSAKSDTQKSQRPKQNKPGDIADNANQKQAKRHDRLA